MGGLMKMSLLGSMTTSWLGISDVEWKEEDPLIKINDEDVTIPQT